jgi:DHA3 family tetracycline resistance protein-like MFS transporter
MRKLSARSVYWLSSFAAGMIFSIVFAANQLYRIQTVGLNPLQLVLVGTTLEVTAFIFEIPTGIIADVYSRRLSVIIGTFLFGIGFLVEGFVPSFWGILLAQVIWGTAWTFISGAHSAWIADEVGVNKVGPVYLKASQLHQVGNLAGIPLFIFLGNLSYRVPIIVGGILFLVLGLFRLIWMPETGFTPADKDETETWDKAIDTFRGGIQLALGKPILLTFALIAVFVGLYSEGYDRLSEAHFINQFRFPSLGFEGDPLVLWFALMRVTGLILAVGSIEIIKYRLKKNQNYGSTRYLIGIYGIISLGLLIFAFSEKFFLSILAVLAIDTMRSITGPLIDTFINSHIRSEVRATMLSMTAQLDAFGQMLGGPLVGFIGNFHSIRAALTASSLLLLPVVPLYRRIYHLSKPTANRKIAFTLEGELEED